MRIISVCEFSNKELISAEHFTFTDVKESDVIKEKAKNLFIHRVTKDLGIPIEDFNWEIVNGYEYSNKDGYRVVIMNSLTKILS